MSKYCPKCGRKQSSNSRFCVKCGYDFERNISKPKRNSHIKDITIAVLAVLIAISGAYLLFLLF